MDVLVAKPGNIPVSDLMDEETKKKVRIANAHRALSHRVMALRRDRAECPRAYASMGDRGRFENLGTASAELYRDRLFMSPDEVAKAEQPSLQMILDELGKEMMQSLPQLQPAAATEALRGAWAGTAGASS